MKVYAHRGASIERPENTLGAFALALELGADGIELDCHRAKDGRVVVIHDDTLDRTTDATGPVSAMTSEELRRVDAGAGEHVPTLDEVLGLVAGKLRVNVEIKALDAVDGIVEATARFPELDWFASAGSWDAAELIRERGGVEVFPGTIGAPENVAEMIELLGGELTEEQRSGRDGFVREWPAALEHATRIGASGLSIFERRLTAEIVDAIHDAGLEAWVWTVNDPDRAVEIAATGADAICTDDPRAVLAALLPAATRA